MFDITTLSTPLLFAVLHSLYSLYLQKHLISLVSLIPVMTFQLIDPLYKDQLFYVLYEEIYINEKLDCENERQSIRQNVVNTYETYMCHLPLTISASRDVCHSQSKGSNRTHSS